MKEFIIKNQGKLFFGTLFFGFMGLVATLNYFGRKEIRANPKVGHYYVFNNFPIEGEEYIMKIKAISADSIEFLLPLQGLMFGFDLNEDEDKIRNADKQGTMYGTETIKLSKAKIKTLLDNDSLFDAGDKNKKISAIF